MKQISRLLIIRLSALGDICMTLPVIDSVCRQHPQVEFTFLTSPLGAKIADTVLQLHNLKVKSINKKDYSGLVGINRLYSELKAEGYDAVADLHDVLRTKWTRFRFRLSGHQVAKIDKGRSQKKALVNHTSVNQLRSSIQRYADVFEELNLDVTIDYDAKKVANRLQTQPLMHKAIGIAPFAQHQGKIYPLDAMKQVIEQILAQIPDIQIYLFGSREEQPVLDSWVALHPQNIICVAGRQSIAQDLQLMSSLHLMVSMDSANMHLASLVGLRCLSIWGATHCFAGFLGFGQKSEDCIQLDLPCRPCSIYGNKPCNQGNYSCMSNLLPSVVASRIISAIDN